MNLSSSAFHNDAKIPAKYTCDGRDVTPPLKVENVPESAVSLALIVDDPDAPRGTWDHWIIWNIPPTATTFAEGQTPAGVVGRNSWNENSWGGPCPPSGEHRYFFRIFALDTRLDLPPDAGKARLEEAMKGHVIEQTQLIGRYARAPR